MLRSSGTNVPPPGRPHRDVVGWEYLIVALPAFGAPTGARGASASVAALNGEGSQGWEAVGMTALPDGTVAVLLKRPKAD
jgi:hypothetical protein